MLRTEIVNYKTNWKLNLSAVELHQPRMENLKQFNYIKTAICWRVPEESFH